MDTAEKPLIVAGREVVTQEDAENLFEELFTKANDREPELMEYFPEEEDNGALINSLNSAAIVAETEGVHSGTFMDFLDLISAFPNGTFSG